MSESITADNGALQVVPKPVPVALRSRGQGKVVLQRIFDEGDWHAWNPRQSITLPKDVASGERVLRLSEQAFLTHFQPLGPSGELFARRQTPRVAYTLEAPSWSAWVDEAGQMRLDKGGAGDLKINDPAAGGERIFTPEAFHARYLDASVDWRSIPLGFHAPEPAPSMG